MKVEIGAPSLDLG